MGFGEATKVGLKKVFVFEGRARRAEFWWYYLFLCLISFAVSLVAVVIMLAAFVPTFASIDSDGNIDDDGFVAAMVGMGVVYFLLFLFGIALIVMMLGAQARRLHDTGQSAQWLWLHLLGLGIVPLIMCIMEGQAFPNQYGPDPKALERGYPGGAVSYAAPPVYPPAAVSPPPPPPPGAVPPPPGDPFVR